MNTREADILNCLAERPYTSQRDLAQASGCSLGAVNAAVRALTREGYLDEGGRVTEKARAAFARCAPRNAVILAAGTGMRMAPINMESPKGLLEIHGQVLIERLVCQLHEAGVTEIYVVVGFMKEAYEYLIDRYGVRMVVNRDYAVRNNLHSLALVADRLSNTYVLPSDVWCAQNPFSRRELYSWYMVTDAPGANSTVRVNRKSELVLVPPASGGNAMIGVSYIAADQAEQVRARLLKMDADPRCGGAFWEDALCSGDKMLASARLWPSADAVEINTYEQLRELDGGSRNLRSDALAAAAKALGVPTRDITDIETLKKGMTNRSFVFACGGRRYIMRVPGEGTEKLIDRRQEAAVYARIRDRGLCDAPVYIDPDSGYKLTRYLEGVRCCDPANEDDLRLCMKKLRDFHRLELTVEHSFDIFGSIGFYETLWNGARSIYRDYEQTKGDVFSLRPYLDAHGGKKALTHIDAVPDNFLILPDGSVQLTDWEYAGMQDPHVDIAMFCIYSLFDRQQADRLIDIYFEDACPEAVRTKIYGYIAACGLLWSNWCEYKRNLGVEFGEYSLRQYRYAKEYYRIVQQRLRDGG